METPDRVWLGDACWYPVEVRGPMYLRATPELLALIEQAKTFGVAHGGHGALVSAALTFAKSQDNPDAG